MGSVAPDDEFDYDTVSQDMEPGALIDRLTTDDRKPINEPYMIDVQDFRNKLDNILLNCSSEVEDTGHAQCGQHTGGSQASHRRQNRLSAVTDAPEETKTTITHGDRHPVEDLRDPPKDFQKVYTLGSRSHLSAPCEDYQRIKCKEIDTVGMLPVALTGRETIEHIEGKTMTDIVAT